MYSRRFLAASAAKMKRGGALDDEIGFQHIAVAKILHLTARLLLFKRSKVSRQTHTELDTWEEEDDCEHEIFPSLTSLEMAHT